MVEYWKVVLALNDIIMMFLYISKYTLTYCQYTRVEQDCLNIYDIINGLSKTTFSPGSHNTI